MRDIAFSSFQEINKLHAGRDIVLFGAGVTAGKTARHLDVKQRLIVDNNQNMWNSEQLNVKVCSPEELENGGSEKYFVIICTTSFVEVSDQLNKLNFINGKDCIVSPILNDLRIIHELESIERSLLITSGVPPEDHDQHGGGIYQLDVKGDNWHHKKVYSGTCYGIIKKDDTFVAIDDARGIVVLSKDYKVLNNRELHPGTRAHGIAYSNDTQRYYIAASYLDKVLVFDDDFTELEPISLSSKIDHLNEPCHHCNDVCVINQSLYVSMFSRTGNFKRDIFDGVVLEYDLVSGECLGTVIQDLWMPHNISFQSGSITVLDSLRGQLKVHNAQVIGQFPGFSRGLDYDGIYYYIGQSRNRNYSKYLGLSNNISIDTSVIIFDETTKVSRSLQLPPKLSEIHSILLL